MMNLVVFFIVFHFVAVRILATLYVKHWESATTSDKAHIITSWSFRTWNFGRKQTESELSKKAEFEIERAPQTESIVRALPPPGTSRWRSKSVRESCAGSTRTRPQWCRRIWARWRCCGRRRWWQTQIWWSPGRGTTGTGMNKIRKSMMCFSDWTNAARCGTRLWRHTHALPINWNGCL